MTAPPVPPPPHTAFMQRALELAAKAAQREEVPVGAVVVRHGAVVGEGYNQCVGLNDPSAHAEIQALRSAAARLGNYRLEDCDVYVTLEPCAMCAQAMLHARVSRVFFGAPEPRFGAAGSVLNLFAVPGLNPCTTVAGGLLAEESRALLQSFFRERRLEQAQSRWLPEHAPLREDALRTPASRFSALQGFCTALDAVLASRGMERLERASTRLPGLQGLRLHWMELAPLAAVPPPSAGALNLVLHSPDGWWPESALMAMTALTEQTAGAPASAPSPGPTDHWLLPDLVGLGQSDKPKKATWHSLAAHVAYLLALLEEQVLSSQPGLEFRDIHLWFAPEQAALALALPSAATTSPVLEACRWHATRLPSVWANGSPSLPSLAAQLPPTWRELPFPDRGHEVARRCWSQMPAT